MSFEVDQDILQDFLIEAGEILELLSEQLVDLEQSPEDPDLLNAIFRGFHTVKGGAGFLNLTPLVEICHGAENLFDLLRNGSLSVNAELMDVIFWVLVLLLVYWLLPPEPKPVQQPPVPEYHITMEMNRHGCLLPLG